MATYTPNYGLHQWESSDDFLRTDFNTDHALIDAALGELAADKAEIVTGMYTGNGANSQFISLGFAPKAVLVVTDRGMTSAYGGLAVPGQMVSEPHGEKVLEITGAGLTAYGVGSSWSKGNSSGTVFFYLAVK